MRLGPARAAAFAAIALSSCGRTSLADLVVYGRVWTGDRQEPWAEAIAVAGDTIIAVGDSAEIARYVGSPTRVLAHNAAMVVPGFMDSHLHFMSGGMQLANVDLRAAKSPEEFVSRLKAFAAERSPGEWIIGGDWDHESWPGSPLPRREWIDSVTPNNPVFVDRLDGHMSLANSLALKLAGITKATREIPGGAIVRDSRTSEPTGILKDDAQGPVEAVIPPPTPEQEDRALERAMAWAASKGVTAIADMSQLLDAWRDLAAYQRARATGRLTVRVSLFVPLAAWRRLADSIAAHGRGDDWLQIGGLKEYVDGSLGSSTALFYEPYEDEPTTKGLLTVPEDSLRAWIGGADSAGLQLAIHAIGDRANSLLLDIFDSVSQAHGPRDRRFRIEHAQHLRRQDIERIAAQGVIASMQPYHAIDDGRWAEKRIGPERIKTTYAFRNLIERGARLAFGSDWTVAPIDPILGIYSAVTRRTLDGKNPNGWVPEQKITVEEALRAYTFETAYGVFAEGRRGVLKPGYKADLVVLDKDLTAIPPEALESVGIRATVVGGAVVFQSDQ